MAQCAVCALRVQLQLDAQTSTGGLQYSSEASASDDHLIVAQVKERRLQQELKSLGEQDVQGAAAPAPPGVPAPPATDAASAAAGLQKHGHAANPPESPPLTSEAATAALVTSSHVPEKATTSASQPEDPALDALAVTIPEPEGSPHPGAALVPPEAPLLLPEAASAQEPPVDTPYEPLPLSADPSLPPDAAPDATLPPPDATVSMSDAAVLLSGSAVPPLEPLAPKQDSVNTADALDAVTLPN